MKRLLLKGGEFIFKESRELIAEEGENKVLVIAENKNIEIVARAKGGTIRIEIRGFAKGKRIKIVGKLLAESGDKGKGELIIKGLVDNGEMEVLPAIENASKEALLEHGAYVKEMSKEEIFYLRSRGIREERAKRLIVNAFLMKG